MAERPLENYYISLGIVFKLIKKQKRATNILIEMHNLNI